VRAWCLELLRHLIDVRGRPAGGFGHRQDHGRHFAGTGIFGDGNLHRFDSALGGLGRIAFEYEDRPAMQGRLLHDPFYQVLARRIELLAVRIEQERANRILHLPAVIDHQAEGLAGNRPVRRLEGFGPSVVAVPIDLATVPKVMHLVARVAGQCGISGQAYTQRHYSSHMPTSHCRSPNRSVATDGTSAKRRKLSLLFGHRIAAHLQSMRGWSAGKTCLTGTWLGRNASLGRNS
jgi:hypothetical protein